MRFKVTRFKLSGKYYDEVERDIPASNAWMDRKELIEKLKLDDSMLSLVEPVDADAAGRAKMYCTPFLYGQERRQNCLVNGLLFVDENRGYHLRYNHEHVIAVPKNTPPIPGFTPLKDWGLGYFYSAFRDHLNNDLKVMLNREFGRCPGYLKIVGFELGPSHSYDGDCGCFGCSGPVEEAEEHVKTCKECW